MWRSFPLYTASQYNGSKIQCMIRILTWKVIFNAILVYFHVHRILGVLWHCPSYISITLSHSFSSHCPSWLVFYWDFWKWTHLCIGHFQSDGVLLLMIEKEKEEYGMYLMDGENEERKEDFNETVSLDGDPSYYVIWKLHQQTLVLRTDTTKQPVISEWRSSVQEMLTHLKIESESHIFLQILSEME